jgi:signal peptidase I
MRISTSLILLFVVIILSLGALSLSDKQVPANFINSNEINSPGDWIKENQISVYEDKVVLNVQNAIWASFTDTNSMDPFIDSGSNAIQIKPKPGQISVGDVIAYKSSYGTIIHRVISIGLDDNGVYYTVKGDNNAFQDPSKVRFDDIVGVVVAVVY